MSAICPAISARAPAGRPRSSPRRTSAPWPPSCGPIRNICTSILMGSRCSTPAGRHPGPGGGAGLSCHAHHQRHPAGAATKSAAVQPGGGEGERLPPLLRGEPRGGAGGLSDRLPLLRQGGRGDGKKCALRLWNLGDDGGGRLNGDILAALEETFPPPGPRAGGGPPWHPASFWSGESGSTGPTCPPAMDRPPPSATACGTRWGCWWTGRWCPAVWTTRAISRWEICSRTAWRRF